jgi:hypothetical protein
MGFQVPLHCVPALANHANNPNLSGSNSRHTLHEKIHLLSAGWAPRSPKKQEQNITATQTGKMDFIVTNRVC